MRLLSIVCAAAALTGGAAAQSPPPAATSRATFEVASVKQNKSGDPRSRADAAPSGRVDVTNMSLPTLIRNAFELQAYELVNGPQVPAWVETDRWDIVAQGNPISDPAAQQRLRAMLRNLLIDRFTLVTKREVRDVPVYALVFARSDRRLGPQISPSVLDCGAQIAAARVPGTARGNVRQCGRNIGPGSITTNGVPLGDLARALSVVVDRFVIDDTGSTERFDVTLTWTPDSPAAGAAVLTDEGSLFTALREQLGLRLQPRNAPVSVFVVESAERPTED